MHCDFCMSHGGVGVVISGQFVLADVDEPDIIIPSVMCFTNFDVVPKTMDVFHDWIKKDVPVYRKKLVLKPPRWSTVSSIKLRESDRGPWRVEVRDADGKLLSTVRFSITE